MSTKKRILSAFLVLCMLFGLMSVFSYAEEAEDEPLPIWNDKSYSAAERAAALVAEMTLNEKAGQMIHGAAPAIPRLNLSQYSYWNEALHGIARQGPWNGTGNPGVLYNLTSYPISMSLGSSWDTDLIYRVAAATGDEGRDVVNSTAVNAGTGAFNGLTYYSPTVNLNRDPRWGRSDESYGEDPFHVSQMASQFVNGMEGNNKDGSPIDPYYKKTVTTIKHYLGNNSENNRLNGSTNITERELREYYSYVYRLIVKNSNVSSVMTSYNRINEVPGGINPYTLDTLLRQTFGFDGYVTSDCDSVWMAFTGSGYDASRLTSTGNGHGWRIPKEDGSVGSSKITGPETVAWGVSSGGDLQCRAGYSGAAVYYNTVIPTAVNAKITTSLGLFTENDVDVSLHRIMTERVRLGELDWDTPGTVKWYDDAKSRIATYGDNWRFVSSTTSDVAQITDARVDLALEAAEKTLVLLKNDPVRGTENKLLPLQIPATGDFKVAVIGHFARPNTNNNFFLGGYSCTPGTSMFPKMVDPFNGISAAVKAINPDAEVTFYKGFTGTGTTAATLTAVDPAAIAAAGLADLCIVYVGTDSGSANEQNDRIGGIPLPGAQASLIKQVGDANPKTVAVMETISQNDVSVFDESVPAMIWSCYNGMVKGKALANILTGKANPSGRTSTLWFKDNSQLANVRSYKLSPGVDDHYDSIYGKESYLTYNGGLTATGGTATYGYTLGETNGRTYMYYDEAKGGAVKYPFGYGLSYTTFEYSNLRVSGLNGTVADANATLNVSVDVKNTGAVKGSEVVELYVATPGAPAEKEYPIKRLKGFDKVELNPGETKTVTLALSVPDLAFFNEASSKFEVYNGAYQIQISKSSWDKDIQVFSNFTVAGSLKPLVSVVTAKPVQEGDLQQDIPQRLIFDRGMVVTPQLTISMSDDTLYGYISKGKSVAIPSSINISYASNRPSVVTVDAAGVIRTTLTKGVATVTATVTDTNSGSVGTCEFIVYNSDKNFTISDLTSPVTKIVEGYAARIPFAVSSKDPASVKVKLFVGDDEAASMNAVSGVFEISKDDAKAGLSFVLKAYENDVETVYISTIECVELPKDIWKPLLVSNATGYSLTFAAHIEFSSPAVTVAGQKVIDFNIEAAEDNVVFINTALRGNVIISGIKYPELFPSYKFTFSLLEAT